MKRPEALVDFLTRLLFAGILGSAVIVAVAPFLRPAVLPPWLEGPSRSIRAHAALERAANGLADALLWGQRPSTPIPPLTPLTPANAPSAAPAATPKPSASAPAATRALPAHAYWGLVNCSLADVHNSEGDVPLQLPVGTTLHVLGRTTTQAGPMVECRLVEAGGSKPFMLPADAVNVYAGSFDAVPDPTLAACLQYARRQVDLARLQDMASNVDREDNPYLHPYRAARDAYVTSNRQARDLQARFTDATGDERIQLGERLRLMKTDEVRLQQALAAARKPYDAWNAAHPDASGAAKDPKVAALEKELATLAARLPPPATPP